GLDRASVGNDRSIRSDQHSGTKELSQDAPGGGAEGAQVEPERAVRDPLEVVRELLAHRRLVAAPHLGEAGQPGPDNEALPVRGQLLGELLEEAWPNRTRPDEAHVALE